MDSFSGDYYGHRCSSGRKSGDVFNDYLDIKKGVQLSKPSWRLHKLAIIEEYQDWERHMERGFRRCRKYNDKFSAMMGMVLLTGVWTLK
jgi:hypothetical protein